MDCSQFLLTKQEIESNKNLILISPTVRSSGDNLSDDTGTLMLSCSNDVQANSQCYVTGWVCSQLAHQDCRDNLSSLTKYGTMEETHISLKNTLLTVNCVIRII
jgi:hypothetical protein